MEDPRITAQKNVIRTNLLTLCNDTVNMDQILAGLQAADVINQNLADEITLSGTPFAQNKAMYTVVSKKLSTPGVFQSLINVLRSSRNEDMVVILAPPGEAVEVTVTDGQNIAKKQEIQTLKQELVANDEDMECDPGLC